MLAQTPIIFNAAVDVMENLWRVASGKGWHSSGPTSASRSFLRAARGIPTNFLFAPLDVAASAVMADRGHMVSQVTAAVGAQMVGNIAGGTLGAVVGGMIGGPLGSVVGEIAGNVIGYSVARGPIGRGMQHVQNLGRTARHLNFGGNYEDSEQAYTMRQVAAREMAGSLLNARQWLGKEAAFMHE